MYPSNGPPLSLDCVLRLSHDPSALYPLSLLRRRDDDISPIVAVAPACAAVGAPAYCKCVYPMVFLILVVQCLFDLSGQILLSDGANIYHRSLFNLSHSFGFQRYHP